MRVCINGQRPMQSPDACKAPFQPSPHASSSTTTHAASETHLHRRKRLHLALNRRKLRCIRLLVAQAAAALAIQMGQPTQLPLLTAGQIGEDVTAGDAGRVVACRVEAARGGAAGGAAAAAAGLLWEYLDGKLAPRLVVHGAVHDAKAAAPEGVTQGVARREGGGPPERAAAAEAAGEASGAGGSRDGGRGQRQGAGAQVALLPVLLALVGLLLRWCQ